MSNTNLFGLFLLPLLLFALGCSKDKLKVNVPSYIHIEDITVSTDYYNEGSGSDNIVDAWILIDYQLIGVFELPVTLPVDHDGVHRIDIRGGIKRNGLTTDRISYPFHDSYLDTSSISLMRGEITTIEPVVTYYKDINFLILEDFESPASMFIEKNKGDSSSVRLIDSDIAFEGNACGAFSVDTIDYKFEMTAASDFEFPDNTTTIYLEFDYKVDQILEVGFYSSNNANPPQVAKSHLISLKPKDEWNKIYLNLTSEIAAFPNAEKFNLYFEAENNLGLVHSDYYFDNIKVIYQ
ncbi:MAG: hypothetical protein HRT72_01725 [Flavobacteriales bacterium]|nr:hypothetical protein [Flavobacteriales bacterium]